MGFSWILFGCLWYITIIGIPIGKQCFKFAALSFFPFGREIRYGGGVVSLLLNIVWLLTTGIPMAVEFVTYGVIFCVTLLGIPFGLQCFKLAKLSLMPFGAEILDKNNIQESVKN